MTESVFRIVESGTNFIREINPNSIPIQPLIDSGLLGNIELPEPEDFGIPNDISITTITDIDMPSEIQIQPLIDAVNELDVFESSKTKNKKKLKKGLQISGIAASLTGIGLGLAKKKLKIKNSIPKIIDILGISAIASSFLINTNKKTKK